MVEAMRQILGESEPEALPQKLEDDILEQKPDTISAMKRAVLPVAVEEAGFAAKEVGLSMLRASNLFRIGDNIMQMIKPEDRTPYVKLIVERYHDTAYPPDGSEASYEDYANYLGLVNGPRTYGVEDEMMTYAQRNKNATIKELMEYFDTLADGREPVEDPDGNEWLDEDD